MKGEEALESDVAMEVDETLEADTTIEPNEEDYAQEDMEMDIPAELVETEEGLEAETELSSTCSAGIRRWSSSANTLAAWKRAESASSAFVDSEF